MSRRLIPLSALLTGSLFLLIAGGINGLILPIRGLSEGFSAFSLGLLGTGWAAGYVLGCIYTPVLVAGAGHIRVFGALAAIFYCLALIPTAISSRKQPAPLFEVKLNIARLWRNSPVAVFAVLMIGISNGGFGALAPVYAERIGLDLTAIVLFSSLPILAGAAAQIPVGRASDRFDRRKVLVFTALVAMAASSAFLFTRPETANSNLLFGAVLGAMIYAMYPIIVAHANDHAGPGEYISTSGGLLMVFGIGSIVGPFIGGIAISVSGPLALFWTMLGAHVLILLFSIWRILQREKLDIAEKGSFQNIPPARNSTPETGVLADRLGQE